VLVATAAEVAAVEESTQRAAERTVERRQPLVAAVTRREGDDKQGNVERGQLGSPGGELQRHGTWCRL
jgi:hypothetical protein